jgi:hypothetical protein
MRTPKKNVNKKLIIMSVYCFIMIVLMVDKKLNRRDPLRIPSLKNYAATAALAGRPRLIVSPAAILAALTANFA